MGLAPVVMAIRVQERNASSDLMGRCLSEVKRFPMLVGCYARRRGPGSLFTLDGDMQLVVERALWWGAFYERLVRSVKNTLKKVIDRRIGDH